MARTQKNKGKNVMDTQLFCLVQQFNLTRTIGPQQSNLAPNIGTIPSNKPYIYLTSDKLPSWNLKGKARQASE